MKMLILSVLILFSTIACQATSPEKAKEAYLMVQAGKAVFIDVREEDEIKSGMIDKAAWIPLSKIQADENWKEEFLKITKDKKIFLYCRSGSRSGKVKIILEDKGILSENLGGYEALKSIYSPTEVK